MFKYLVPQKGHVGWSACNDDRPLRECFFGAELGKNRLEHEQSFWQR